MAFAAALFVVVTAVTTATGFQAAPFFVWGMFSEPMPLRAVYDVWEFREGTQRLGYSASWECSNFGRFFIVSPQDHFAAMMASGEHENRTFLRAKLGAKLPAALPYLLPLLERITPTPADSTAFRAWQRRFVSAQAGRQWVGQVERAEMRSDALR